VDWKAAIRYPQFINTAYSGEPDAAYSEAANRRDCAIRLSLDTHLWRMDQQADGNTLKVDPDFQR
jgi:hypothetical protein